jgi:hypothetical protein
MAERPGELNTLLVMVLMVIDVPPLSMVGRYETATNLLVLELWVSVEVNLFRPPLGLLYSLVEILGEGGEERIGQSDRFAMV